MSVICKFCKKEYTTTSTHNRHVKEVHNEVPDGIIEDNPKLSNRCLECDCAFVSNIKLMIHLEKFHGIEFVTCLHNVKNFTG